MPVMPIALTRSSTELGLLHHCRQRLLGQPARFQEAREVAAFAQLGDAQLHCAGARLPRPVAVAVALGDPLRTALAMGKLGGLHVCSEASQWRAKIWL